MNKYIIALLKCKGVSNSKIARYIINNEFNIYKIKNNLRNIIEYDDYLKFDEYLYRAEVEINLNHSHDIELITILDHKFPKKLYQGPDPVIYLYYKGNIDLINSKTVSIVSSNDVSNKSLSAATKVSSIISTNDITIVGALSNDLDTYVHLGAMAGSGNTIAVLSSDLEHIYPLNNSQIAQDILKNNGCLVSEYSLGEVINKYSYSRRNLVMSSLSDALLVIEAKETNPVMEMVKKAKKENKLVYQLSSNLNKTIRNVINIDRYSDINSFIKKVKEEKRESNEQLTLF